MITNDNTQAVLLGNGVSTVINTVIKVYDSKALLVYKGTQESLGVLLTEGIHYTVSGVSTTDNTGLSSEAGAVITLSAAPVDGVVIRVVRETPATQGAMVRNSKAFDPAVYELALDQIVMAIQEFKTALASAFKLFGTNSDFFVPISEGFLGFNDRRELVIIQGFLHELGVSSWLAPLLLAANPTAFLAGLGAIPSNIATVLTDWHEAPNNTGLLYTAATSAANAPNSVDTFVGLWIGADANNGALILVSTGTPQIRFKTRSAGTWDTIYDRVPVHYTGNTVINSLNHGAGTYFGLVDQGAAQAPTTDSLGNALGTHYAAFMSIGAAGLGRFQFYLITSGTYAGYIFVRWGDDSTFSAWKQLRPTPSQLACFAWIVSSGTSSGPVWTSLTKHTLNTTMFNTIPGMSIASDSVVFPAGEYEAEGYVSVNNGSCKCVLRNETDSTNIVVSANAISVLASTNDTAYFKTRFTLTAQKTLAIYSIYTSGSTSKGGAASLGGLTEEYARLYIRKLDW